MPVKPFDFLLAPLSGGLDAAIAGRPARLGPSQALLVAAGVPHRGQRTNDAPALAACTLHLDLRDEAGAPLLARWREPILVCPPGWTEALARLHALPDRDLRFRLAAVHLRALLLAQDHPEALLTPVAAPGRLAGLLRLLIEHPGQSWDAPAMAQAAGISPTHLRALFRRELGCSPHRHLVRLRVRHAGELLQDGATVAQAATAAGFASVRGLRLAFRRELGRSPGAWRWGE
jgi:AraC-like DNA-binding protein